MDDKDPIARCDREIAEMQLDSARDTQPAFLTTMGFEDWEAEKRLLLEERAEKTEGD